MDKVAGEYEANYKHNMVWDTTSMTCDTGLHRTRLATPGHNTRTVRCMAYAIRMGIWLYYHQVSFQTTPLNSKVIFEHDQGCVKL